MMMDLRLLLVCITLALGCTLPRVSDCGAYFSPTTKTLPRIKQPPLHNCRDSAQQQSEKSTLSFILANGTLECSAIMVWNRPHLPTLPEFPGLSGKRDAYPRPRILVKNCWILRAARSAHRYLLPRGAKVTQ